MSVLVKRFAASHAATRRRGAALPRWARAAFLTTIRAGLLLAGDLGSPPAWARRSPPPVGIDPADVVRDLSVWSTSESYSELRRALGLRTITL